MAANVTYRPHYQTVDGIRFPAMFKTDCIKQAMNYKPKHGDLFIATYPKCGTTWMQNIVLYIHRKGRELEKFRDYYQLCPNSSISMGEESVKRRAFKTHLPFDRMPYSSEAKYIVVSRNPKDCCVSLFHYTKNNAGFGYWDAKFDDFFELFLAGEVLFNDYFDHLMSWYPHRNDENVFFTTYEDMKRDTRGTVLKVAGFIGKEYLDPIEKDNAVLENILRLSSFEYMSENVSKLYDLTLSTEDLLSDPDVPMGVKHMARYVQSLNPPIRGELQFVRKGMVGDWKTHLSEEQSERLSKKFLERTEGTEIQELYRNFL